MYLKLFSKSLAFICLTITCFSLYGTGTQAVAQSINCESIMVQCDNGPANNSFYNMKTTPSSNIRRTNQMNFDYPLEGKEIDVSELPVFPMYRPRGVPPRDEVLALWFGSADSTEEAQLIWENILPILSEILENPQPSYLLNIIPAEYSATNQTIAVFRIYLGPIPDEATGWQVCNVLALERPKSFCKPWDVHSI